MRLKFEEKIACCENISLKNEKYNLYHIKSEIKLLVPEKRGKKLPELNSVLFINVKNRNFVVYGHITLKTPVLVRSPKLSNVEPG